MFTKLRNEFRFSRFGFQHKRPLEFATWTVSSVFVRFLKNRVCIFCVRMKWQEKNSDQISGYFIIYRCIIAALFLSILVADGSITDHPEYFFIYLTNLGFLLQTLHLVVSAALPIQQVLYFQSGIANYDDNYTALLLI